MSRIQALDEITERMGPPAFLRWVDAPYDASAAVVREGGGEISSRHVPRTGSIFPGTAWHDPEFDGEVSYPLGFDPQQLLGYVLCLLLVVAVALALWMRS